ncbi:1195_t:CDS:2 [Ambispora gerdemannii]|uniref:1195_t:CDS:1 n=1 Tax=Ambispora gerdemannii TaxID=144530 RepID=A0A9N8UWL7_9GLOM|nr:1195_t:CDS:2 [Ambispora gerdemannii]
MVAEVIDYRLSRLVVLCKDCGQDVGLYPARHKCGTSSSDATEKPPIPKKKLAGSSSSSGGGTTNGWAKLKAAKNEGKLSENNTQNSVNADARSTDDSNNDGLWNKLRGVRNWKDVSEGANPSQGTQGAKLWDKLLNATSTLKSNMTADSDNESEKEGWEGETHISRILREYHEKKSSELPDWLYSEEYSRPKKRGELLSGKSSDKTTSPLPSQRGSIEKNEEQPSYPKKSFKDIYALWESESTTATTTTISSSSAKPITLPNRMGYQSNGNTSSLPNSYDSGRYVERSNTKQYHGNTSSSSFLQAQPHSSSRSSQIDQYSQHRTNATTGQCYDDMPNRARSLSPNPSSRGHPQNHYDNDGYGVYSGVNDGAASRSRGRSSNRQGGYYG